MNADLWDLLLKTYYSLRKPQGLIALPPGREAKRGAMKQGHANKEIAKPSGLAMTTFDDWQCNLFHAPVIK